MRVVGAAQAELSARVLPCLPVVVPMETKLCQLLPYPGGGCLLELHPNPAGVRPPTHNLCESINVGQGVQELV